METLAEYIVEILVAGFGAAILAFVKQYLSRRWQIDLADYLDMDEMEKAIKYGKKKAKQKLGDKADAVEFEQEALQKAFEFIYKQAPRWLREYGVDEDQVKQWLESKYDE